MDETLGARFSALINCHVRGPSPLGREGFDEGMRSLLHDGDKVAGVLNPRVVLGLRGRPHYRKLPAPALSILLCAGLAHLAPSFFGSHA